MADRPDLSALRIDEHADTLVVSARDADGIRQGSDHIKTGEG